MGFSTASGCAGQRGKNWAFIPMEASQVKRQWDKRKEIELLCVANFDVSFKLLASLPKKKTQNKTPVFVLASLEHSSFCPRGKGNSSSAAPKKPQAPKILGEKFPDPVSQFLSYCWKNQESFGKQRGCFLQVAKHC